MSGGFKNKFLPYRIYDPQAIDGDAFDLTLHTGLLPVASVPAHASTHNVGGSDALTTTSDAETTPSTILAGDANGRLRLDGLGIGAAPTGQELRLDGDLIFVGAQSISTTAGNLTLAPAGDTVVSGKRGH